MARLFNPNIANFGTDPANQQLVQQGLAQLQDKYDRAKEMEFNARLQAGESFLNADDLNKFNQDLDRITEEAYKGYDGKIGFGVNHIRKKALEIMQHPARKAAETQKALYNDMLKQESAGNIVLNKRDILSSIYNEDGSIKQSEGLQVVSPDELTKTGIQTGQSYISGLTPKITRNATPGYIDISRMSPMERDAFLMQNGEQLTNQILEGKGIDTSKLTADQKARLHGVINQGLSLGLTDEVKTQEDKAYWMNLQIQKQKDLYNWKKKQQTPGTGTEVNPKTLKTPSGTATIKEILKVKDGKEFLNLGKNPNDIPEQDRYIYKQVESEIDETAKNKVKLDMQTSAVYKVSRTEADADKMVEDKWIKETQYTPFKSDNTVLQNIVNETYRGAEDVPISMTDKDNFLLKALESKGLAKWITGKNIENVTNPEGVYVPTYTNTGKYEITDPKAKEYIELQNARINGTTPVQLARKDEADKAMNGVRQRYDIEFNTNFPDVKEADDKVISDMVDNGSIFKLVPTDKAYFKKNLEGIEDYWSEDAKKALQFGHKGHKYKVIDNKVYLTIYGKDNPKKGSDEKGGEVTVEINPAKAFDRGVVEGLSIRSDNLNLHRDATLSFDYEELSKGVSLNQALKRIGEDPIPGGDYAKVKPLANGMYGTIIDGKVVQAADYRNLLETLMNTYTDKSIERKYNNIKSELYSTSKQKQAEVKEDLYEDLNFDL